MDYLLHLCVLAGIYVTLAISLDLVVGHTGMLSAAHGAFYGIGAYASTLLVVDADWPFVVAFIAAAALAALMSVCVSLTSFRLRNDFFFIVTLGFQLIVTALLENWASLTRGPLGISGIPRPTLGGWTLNTNLGFAIAAFLLAGAAWGVTSRLISGPFGRVLHAIREDENFAKSLGKNTLRFKVTAYAVSAAIAALAGAIYAPYLTYIDPGSFTVMESVLVLSMVIVGGPASRAGPIAGAAALIIFPEGLRFIGLSGPMAATIRQVMMGLLLVVMMAFRPQGLLGRYDFSRR